MSSEATLGMDPTTAALAEVDAVLVRLAVEFAAAVAVEGAFPVEAEALRKSK